MGDWGMLIVVVGVDPFTNPHSPIPNTQSPIPILENKSSNNLKSINNKKLN